MYVVAMVVPVLTVMIKNGRAMRLPVVLLTTAHTTMRMPWHCCRRRRIGVAHRHVVAATRSQRR